MKTSIFRWAKKKKKRGKLRAIVIKNVNSNFYEGRFVHTITFKFKYEERVRVSVGVFREREREREIVVVVVGTKSTVDREKRTKKERTNVYTQRTCPYINNISTNTLTVKTMYSYRNRQISYTSDYKMHIFN